MERAGIVLCGGRSTRMGQSKALLDFRGETYLQRTVRILLTFLDRIVVIAAAGQELPVLPAHVTVAFDPVSDEGPLRGLATGLGQLDSETAAFATGCDTPFINTDVISLLFDSLGDREIAIPRFGDQEYPLCAVYRSRVLPEVKSMLAKGNLRLRDLLSRCDIAVLDGAQIRTVDPGLRCLRNINTPEEYAEALVEMRNESERP